jgi:hypothetical protein
MPKTIFLSIAISLLLGQSCLADCPDGESRGLFGWCYFNIPKVGWPKKVMEIFPICWGHPQDCDQEVNKLPPPPPRTPQDPPHQPPNITYGDLKCEGPGSDENNKSTWYDPRTLACWFYPNEEVCTGIADGTGRPDNGAWWETGKTCPLGGNYAMISNVTATPARPDSPGPGKQQFCYSCAASQMQLRPNTDIWAIDSTDADRLYSNICRSLARGPSFVGGVRPGACASSPTAAPATPTDQVVFKPSFCFVCKTNNKFTEYQCADLKYNYCTVNMDNMMRSCPPPPHSDLSEFSNRFGDCSLERKQPGLVEVPGQAFP